MASLFQGRDLGRGFGSVFRLQQRQLRISTWIALWVERRWNPRAADHHGREGDAVAFNVDEKDGAIYEKVPEFTYEAFVGMKTSGQQNKDYVGYFALVNS